MHRSLLVRQLVPALAGYLALVPAAILCDAALHRLGLGAIGLWFGPAGTLLIAGSFLYSLRKRRLMRMGQPAKLLALHETLGWIGTLLRSDPRHPTTPWHVQPVLDLVDVASGAVTTLDGAPLRYNEPELDWR